MLKQAKRAELFSQSKKEEMQRAKPKKLGGREPRYKASGEMYAKDIDAGYVSAGWPKVRA